MCDGLKETYDTLSAIITIFLSCATVSLRPCTSANAGWTPFARDNFSSLVKRDLYAFGAGRGAML